MMAWIDLIVCILLFVLLAYVFFSVMITALHKVYLTFHFFMTLWPFCQFAIRATDNPKLQLLYVKLAFVDMALLAVGWLFFTLLLTNQSLSVRKRMPVLLTAPALIAVIAVLLNPGGTFVQPQHGEYVERIYGPLFWITTPVMIGYGIVSLCVIGKALSNNRAPRIKKQVSQVLRGMIVVMAFICADILLNVVFPVSRMVIPGLTSIGILLSAIFFIVAIHRDKVFDLLKIAHQDIINTIQLGILVLDDNETIVETNRSLPPFLHLKTGDRFDMAAILPRREAIAAKQFLAKYKNDPLESSEIEVVYDHEGKQHILVHASPIVVDGTRVGRTITFQDRSRLRELVNETSRQNTILQKQNLALYDMQLELHLTNQKLQRMATTDGLTGCYNRNYITQQLEQEVIKHIENENPFAILLLDIDFFKRINDQYGHLTGDEVICGTVAAIQRQLKVTDILARFGGEEFIVYLPGMDSGQALELAEQIRASVESNEIAVPGLIQPLSVTVSIGLLSVDRFPTDPDSGSATLITDLFQEVDHVLYQAKRNGRNRVMFALK
ncbi:hypothetical protein J2TS6_20980 [Paenibacillus albilobatus]|uniref:GGDEF domain-containing protein n=2 Tax=Paenibacillus TaxID=44249 RepID=A0A920CBX7_9BACL|nr:hypothetical protein J2TS6_20980 [Paenibacillus albilobatus]